MATDSIVALVFPVGDEEPYLTRVVPDLDTMSGLVGGYLQALPLGHGATLYLHEEGKYEGLPLNRHANVLVRDLGVGLAPDDFIVGQVVVTGDHDAAGRSDGMDHDVPEAILAACRRIGFDIEDRGDGGDATPTEA